MPYAHRPVIFDADTHMMERPGWIAAYADPDVRDRLEPFLKHSVHGMQTVQDALVKFDARAQDAAARDAMQAEFMSMQYKGWHGLGAFDAAERVCANDLLGFQAFIVFPTEAFNQVIAATDPHVYLGGVRALNRGMADFCSIDTRMIGTGYLPLGMGPEVALSVLETLIAADFRALLIDTVAPQHARAFTHPDYDGVWARIQDADLAVTLHIGAQGGEYTAVPGSYFNNGRDNRMHSEGDVPPNALSYMGMHYSAALFLSAMIFDGVLQRFPKLRIAVVELGASWIISWMKHIDQSFRAFKRLQDLSDVKQLPSEYAQQRIKVTPFAGEDIGWLLNNGAEHMLMFASDYPHHEGTDDPIGRFERTLVDVSEAQREQFYAGNFRAFMGSRFTASDTR